MAAGKPTKLQEWEALKAMLQAARARLGLTAKEFTARDEEWSFHTYIKWEMGQRAPTVRTLVRFAEAFGASSLDLVMTFEDDEELSARVFERGES